MRTFQTQLPSGIQEWRIAFSIGLFSRVKSQFGIDLMNPNSPVREGDQTTVLMSLQLDLGRFLQALSAVLSVQLKEAGVTQEDFEESLTAESISEAREAFFGEYRDFFMSAGMPTTAAIMDKTLEALATAAVEVRTLTPGISSGNAPASSDATALS